MARLYGGAQGDVDCPAQKVEPALERRIKPSSRRGGLVLDPFVGGGGMVVLATKLDGEQIEVDTDGSSQEASQTMPGLEPTKLAVGSHGLGGNFVEKHIDCRPQHRTQWLWLGLISRKAPWSLANVGGAVRPNTGESVDCGHRHRAMGIGFMDRPPQNAGGGLAHVRPRVVPHSLWSWVYAL